MGSNEDRGPRGLPGCTLEVDFENDLLDTIRGCTERALANRAWISIEPR